MRSRALAETDLTEQIQGRGARVTMVVIDACRNNPFPGAGTRSLSRARGLAVKEPGEGVFAMYSAGRNQEALDRLSDTGDPNPNSVFTRVFVEQIRKPGVSVSEFGDAVRDEVTALARSIGHAQVPAVYNQLLGSRRFYLAGPATPTSR